MMKKIIIPLIASVGGYCYSQKTISLNDENFVSALKYLN
jgi:hypothetical protein